MENECRLFLAVVALLFAASPLIFDELRFDKGAFRCNKVYITKPVVLGIWLKPLQIA
jgi:hypothetical protein